MLLDDLDGLDLVAVAVAARRGRLQDTADADALAVLQAVELGTADQGDAAAVGVIRVHRGVAQAPGVAPLLHAAGEAAVTVRRRLRTDGGSGCGGRLTGRHDRRGHRPWGRA